ncbi:MAG TPA: hypothetical protein VGE78_03295, partial [Agromyces sp.]
MAGRVGAQRRIETPDASALAALAGRRLDLVQAPFTLPRSRVLVFRADRAEVVEGGGVVNPASSLRVHTSEYERWLDDCRVIDELTVRDASGSALPVTAVLPHAIEFGGGAATLTFAGPGALSIGLGRSSSDEGAYRDHRSAGLDTRAPSSRATRPAEEDSIDGLTIEWTTPDGART